MGATTIEWTDRSADYYRRVVKPRREAARPPDALLSIPAIDLAYMAGLIDGEGCIRIGHVGPKKRTYYPTVEIGMTHRETIEWIQSLWLSGSIKINNHSALRSRGPNWKTQWIVRIHGKRAKLLCELLLPFLRTKRQQAELVCQFPCDVRDGGITPAIDACRNDLFDKMRLLNRRGATNG